jgi:molybdate transport system substrate-binding protein
MFRTLARATIFAAALAGCGPKSAATPGELMLFCGAGLKPPVDEIVSAFQAAAGVTVVVDYAGSDVLLSKVKAAARGDVFMPGDAYYLERAAAQNLVLTHTTLCYFVPTMLVAKGNPKSIRTLADLLTPGVKLGLGDPEACAVGKQARLLFEKNGIAWEKVQAACTFQSKTVTELGLQIQVGALDAVIVWDATAHYYARHGDEVPIPLEKNVVSEVAAGVLASSARRELAERFLSFAASDEGRKVFATHHYRVEPPR